MFDVANLETRSLTFSRLHWADSARLLRNVNSVVVLEESPSSRTNLQVLVLDYQVLVLGLQTPRKFSRTACVFETAFV